MATLARRFRDNSELNNVNVAKIVIDHESNAIYFSRLPIPHSRDLPSKVDQSSFTCLKHIGLYGIPERF